MRRLAALCLAVVLAAPAAADERTLADIRAELSALQSELDRLERELSPTGAAQSPDDGGSLRDRVDTVGSELQRIIGKTEQLEIRIERIVADGTNRIGDIEFRLTELEGGDIGEIGRTEPLGGEEVDGLGGLDSGRLGEIEADAPEPSAEMAVSEQADFDAAQAALDEGRHEEAVERFTRFVESYPGGPLTPEAQFRRGEALEAEGRDSPAARAYLDAYSAEPDGNFAPDALYRLGRALDTLGQRQESCVMFEELVERFPNSARAGDARAALGDLGCR